MVFGINTTNDRAVFTWLSKVIEELVWFWFYYALWLASVFTLVLVLRQSSENRSISKVLYVLHEPLGKWNLRQFRNITSGIQCQISLQIMLLFVYTITRKGFVISTCRYFKWRWNTTALSQSNWKNFSCSDLNRETILLVTYRSLTRLARRSWRWISE